MGSWDEVGQVIVLTVALYLSVLVCVRVAGRRTVSQMSAFDFVVTVAIGSLVAATVLDPGTGYGPGLAAVVTLLLAQQGVAVLRQRNQTARKLIDFAPEHVYENGELALRGNPMAAQITEAELRSKLRQRGIFSFDGVRVVILEPNGEISVWRTEDDPDRAEP